MKFFLDNCLAIRHARALNEMLEPEHSFIHLQDKFPANTKDET
jgi:predicted nuclease of predicted toxin-antitoxin system